MNYFNIFNAPGFVGGSQRFQAQQMLSYGKQLRDELVWQYPVLPGAVMTYQQIASSREVKVSGNTARSITRAIDWLNSAVSYNLDGTIEYGLQAMLKRRILDYLCVGRTAWYIGDELTYLDPTNMRFHYDITNPYWHYNYTNSVYYPEDLILNHPYPIGQGGYFMSPLVPIIPKAMLAWLLDEHDRAAADGRKIRDIIIAGSEELAKSLLVAMQQSLALWSGKADVTKSGVPVAYLEQFPTNGSVQDMIGKLGLAEIPEAFNRADFEFTYVNEIAAALGIALRHFWNSEKATNRALEDVQEARQLQKGPSEFVRTEQRLLNSHPKALRRFGSKTRMGFIEETDTQTQNSRAINLKAYSEALEKFATVFNGQVNGDAFLAWLQSEGILPADLELITDMGMMAVPEQPEVNPGTAAQPIDPEVSPIASGKTKEKSVDILEYGEITMDLNYNIIDRRLKPYSGYDIVLQEIEKDEEAVTELSEPVLDFLMVLDAARRDNYDKLLDSEVIIDNDVLAEAYNLDYDDLTEEHHTAIREFIYNE